MGIGDRVRKLERVSKKDAVHIPQEDGTVKSFPQSALKAAFLTEVDRMRGEDIPRHPLTEAVSTSSDPSWSNSFFSSMAGVNRHGNEIDPGDVPDLSEQRLPRS
jgi:hypothetical protein